MSDISEESLQKVFMQIGRLHFLISQQVLEKTGLYPGQPPLLFILYKNNGRSQKELAESLMVKPATITVMIRRLEKTGFIERRNDKKDQRISRIFITEKGVEICRKLEVIEKDIEAESFSDFTIEEKIILRRLLLQVKENLGGLYEKAKNQSNEKK